MNVEEEWASETHGVSDQWARPGSTNIFTPEPVLPKKLVTEAKQEMRSFKKMEAYKLSRDQQWNKTPTQNYWTGDG